MDIKVGDLLILNNKTEENITDLQQDPYWPTDGSFFIVSEIVEENYLLFDTQAQIYSNWSYTALVDSIEEGFFERAE